MVEPLISGLKAPIEAIVNPRRFFSKLREYTRRYGVYFTALFYIGAWMASTFTAYFLILAIYMIRDIAGFNLSGLILSPITTLVYSFLFPLVAAGLDSLLIIIPVYYARNRPPLHTVIAVRASSLLPYTIRVVLLAASGDLSLRSLVEASTSLYSLIPLLAGTLLTYYGLVRIGVPKPHSAVGALLPLLYKLAL